MNINNGINQYISLTNNSQSISTNGTENLSGSAISNLKQGQVFEGSVNSISNGKVIIGLSNGQTLSARLDSGISLSQGQSLFFQVKSNDGSLIQIKPVSMDINTNPTLLKALDSAGIIPTEKTLTMVNAMMSESMSIDSESLLTMNKIIVNNPSVNLETAVLMSKFQIPVSTENANVFEAYTSDKAMLSSQINAIEVSLPKILASNNISVSSASEFLDNLNTIFLFENEELNNFGGEARNFDNLNMNLSTASIDTLIESQNINRTYANNEISSDVLSSRDYINSYNGSIDIDESMKDNDNSININKNNVLFNSNQNEINVLNNNAESNESYSLGIDTARSSIFNNGYESVVNILDDEQITIFSDRLKNMDTTGMLEEYFDNNGLINTNISSKNILEGISLLLKNNSSISRQELSLLFKSNSFKSIIKNVLDENFSMSADDITKKDGISKFYSKMLSQINDLEKLVSQFDNKTTNEITNATAQIRDNINFMNSANELYNFIQIPLKMYDQTSDSMLYVKQNKKNSYETGEEITAFLHFDMKHLGSTDVFIRLKEMNVNCNWKLSDVRALELIEKNMNILTERLAKKGFHCNMEVAQSDKETDLIKDFLDAGVSGNINNGLVHRYSFDVRA